MDRNGLPCWSLYENVSCIGGRESNKHWNKRLGKREAYATKTPVIGVIARKGNVICQAVNELGFTTQEDFVRRAVSDKVTLVATDQHAGYRNLRKPGLPHQQVNHSEKQYVVGSVHTNTIENFWSLLKRGIIGNYRHVSREYLPLYLNEFSFRFNSRKNPDIFDAIMAGC
ncbi:MAG: IS1595 family transposase [Candidatus Binatus sp.]